MTKVRRPELTERYESNKVQGIGEVRVLGMSSANSLEQSLIRSVREKIAEGSATLDSLRSLEEKPEAVLSWEKVEKIAKESAEKYKETWGDREIFDSLGGIEGVVKYVVGSLKLEAELINAEHPQDLALVDEVLEEREKSRLAKIAEYEEERRERKNETKELSTKIANRRWISRSNSASKIAVELNIPEGRIDSLVLSDDYKGHVTDILKSEGVNNLKGWASTLKGSLAKTVASRFLITTEVATEILKSIDETLV